MNVSGIIKIGKVVASVGPSLKQWIFSDGKFQKNRAVMLLVFLIVLGGMTYFLGSETTGEVIEQLDEVSDMIGYSE